MDMYVGIIVVAIMIWIWINFTPKH
jgi:hypothetical protein